ncbi:pre-mRNA-splicing factor 38B-like isoform X2 [Clavelina lepadiformis]|uniref:pre-mRNA-splicing factor 38B-like isoform X2 n=1 Tax=Clavelina lepadiformis TaxID=159417 RepID=UPI00404349FF
MTKDSKKNMKTRVHIQSPSLEIHYLFGVEHLEPWERGTRKTAGQTGMCGGVRGVGAGGVVSTAFCCLFKLFTLKLTRKQANGLLNHTDSPYIRGLGVMYVRYTQPPKDLWDWFEYLMDDEEEIDVKSGGGCVMTIGSMVKTVLTKLDWFSTLFPRIPVPIEKQIHENLKAREGEKLSEAQQNLADKRSMEREQQQQSSADRHRSRERSRSHRKESKQRSPEHRRRRSRSPDDQRKSKRSRSRDRRRDSRERKSSRSRDRPRRSRSREKRRRSRSKSRDRHRSYRSR